MAIPTQFILTSSLSKDFHVCLRVLSNKASEDDIKRFIEIANKFTEPIDKQNADAVMNVSINANREVYDKIRKENPFMCQALRELMKDEIQEEKQEAVDAAIITNIKYGCKSGNGNIENLRSRSASIHGYVITIKAKRGKLLATLSCSVFLYYELNS